MQLLNTMWEFGGPIVIQFDLQHHINSENKFKKELSI